MGKRRFSYATKHAQVHKLGTYLWIGALCICSQIFAETPKSPEVLKTQKAYENYIKFNQTILVNRFKNTQNKNLRTYSQNQQRSPTETNIPVDFTKPFAPPQQVHPSWYSPVNLNELRPWVSKAPASIFLGESIDNAAILKQQFPRKTHADNLDANIDKYFQQTDLSIGSLTLSSIADWAPFCNSYSDCNQQKAEKEIAVSSLWTKAMGGLLLNEYNREDQDRAVKDASNATIAARETIKILEEDSKKLHSARDQLNAEREALIAERKSIPSFVGGLGGKSAYRRRSRLSDKIKEKQEEIKPLDEKIKLLNANRLQQEKSLVYSEIMSDHLRQVTPERHLTIDTFENLNPNIAGYIFGEVLGIKNLKDLPYEEALEKISQELSKVYNGQDAAFFNIHNLFGLQDKLAAQKAHLDKIKKEVALVSPPTIEKSNELIFAEKNLYATQVEINNIINQKLQDEAFKKLSLHRPGANGRPLAHTQNFNGLTPPAASNYGEVYQSSREKAPSAVEMEESHNNQLMSFFNDGKGYAGLNQTETTSVINCVHDILEAQMTTAPKFASDAEMQEFIEKAESKTQQCINIAFNKYPNASEAEKDQLFKDLVELTQKVVISYFDFESEDMMRAQAFGIPFNPKNSAMDLWNQYNIKTAKREALEKKDPLDPAITELENFDTLEARKDFMGHLRDVGDYLKTTHKLNAQRNPQTGDIEFDLTKTKIFGPDGLMTDITARNALEEISPFTLKQLEEIETAETCQPTLRSMVDKSLSSIRKIYNHQETSDTILKRLGLNPKKCEPKELDISKFPPPFAVENAIFVVSTGGKVHQYSHEEYNKGISSSMEEIQKILLDLQAKGEDLGKFLTGFAEKSKQIFSLGIYDVDQKYNVLKSQQSVAEQRLLDISKKLVVEYGFGRTGKAGEKSLDLKSEEALVDLFSSSLEPTVGNAKTLFDDNKSITSQVYINAALMIPVARIVSLAGAGLVKVGGLAMRGKRLDTAIRAFSATAPSMKGLSLGQRMLTRGKRLGHLLSLAPGTALNVATRGRLGYGATNAVRMGTGGKTLHGTARLLADPKFAARYLSRTAGQTYDVSKRLANITLMFQGATTVAPVFMDTLGQRFNGSERSGWEIFSETLGRRFADGFTPLQVVKSSAMMLGMAKGSEIIKEGIIGAVKQKVTRQSVSAAMPQKSIALAARDAAKKEIAAAEAQALKTKLQLDAASGATRSVRRPLELAHQKAQTKLTELTTRIESEAARLSGKSASEVLTQFSPKGVDPRVFRTNFNQSLNREVTDLWSVQLHKTANWRANWSVNAITIPAMSYPNAKMHLERHNQLEDELNKKKEELLASGKKPEDDKDYRDLRARKAGHTWEAWTDLSVDAITTIIFSRAAAEVFNESGKSMHTIEATQKQINAKMKASKYEDDEYFGALSILMKTGQVKTGKISKESYQILTKHLDQVKARMRPGEQDKIMPLQYTHNADGTVTIEFRKTHWLAQAIQNTSRIDFENLLKQSPQYRPPF